MIKQPLKIQIFNNMKLYIERKHENHMKTLKNIENIENYEFKEICFS